MTPPAPVPAPAPSTADMIHAIRTVQAGQAAKIGAACVALTSCKTPIVMADLAAEVEILAGLDLALTVLQAGV